MSPIDEFLKDIDALWDAPSGEKLTLYVIGSTALMMQTGYSRGTKDRDVLEARALTPEIVAKLRELAGEHSRLHQKHRVYLDIVPNGLGDRLGQLRSTFQASHKRTIDQAVQLVIGGEYFLRFAVEVGALSPHQATELNARFRGALGTVADSQAESQAASDPVRRFLELLPALFLSGRAHLEGTESQEPMHSDRLGWCHEPGSSPNELHPKGRCIGWEDAANGVLYLEPTACFAEIQLYAGHEGDPFPLGKGSLWKRLKGKGLLNLEDATRNAKKVPGRGHGRGIALKASAIEIQNQRGAIREVA